MDEIRWQQCFSNYQKSLAKLQAAVGLSHIRPLSELEQLGLLHTFEFTHELARKVMKDHLQDQDEDWEFNGSRVALRQAFSRGMIAKGDVWVAMLDSREAAMQDYDPMIACEIVAKIIREYLPVLINFSIEVQCWRG